MTQKFHKRRPAREVELKLAIDKRADGTSQLRDILPVVGMDTQSTRRLRTIYFDTPAHDLRANQMSLRVRQNGDSWRQIVKADTRMMGDLLDPIEIESDVKGPIPDLRAIADTKMRRRLRKILGTNHLERIFETDVRRTTQIVSDTQGNEVEVAFDDGEIKSTADTKEFGELELELIRGRPSGILEIVRQLTLNNLAVRPSNYSKSDRGYRLLLKECHTKLKPKKLNQSPLKSGQTAAKAFRAILESTVSQILHNWSVVLTDSDPEGPHQLRVGVRFLRTLLRAFRPVIDGEDLRALDRDLQELGCIVGELRDLDVLSLEIVGNIERPAALASGFNQLTKDLTEAREKQRAAVRDILLSHKMQTLQIRLALLPNQLGWEHIDPRGRVAKRKIARIARKALDKCWRRAHALGERIDELSVEDRHKLRKKLKGLRYTLEAFSPIYDKKKCRRFVRDLKRLQDIFGYLNDATLAQQLHDRAAVSEDRALHQAIGYVVGHHDAHCTITWHHAKRRWAKLVADDRPWL